MCPFLIVNHDVCDFRLVSDGSADGGRCGGGSGVKVRDRRRSLGCAVGRAVALGGACGCLGGLDVCGEGVCGGNPTAEGGLAARCGR